MFKQRICLLILLTGLAACRNGPNDVRPVRASQAAKRPPLDAQASHLAEMEGVSKVTQNRRVEINSRDIELPMTSSYDRPPEHRSYTFTVWADDPSSTKTAYERWKAKELRVEVEGATAYVSPIAYNATAPKDPDIVVGDKQDSRNLLRLQVSSRGLSRSFQILAWDEAGYRQWENDRWARITYLQQRLEGRHVAECRYCCCEWPPCPEWLTNHDLYLLLEQAIGMPNPWGEIKTVRVFNGDLHTRLLMLSREEVIDAFGPNFEKYFFVARTYFRNQHAEKSLVVNTTSLAAKCLFYREPDKRLARYFLQTSDENLKRFEYAKLWNPVIPQQDGSGSTTTGITKQQVHELVQFAKTDAYNAIGDGLVDRKLTLATVDSYAAQSSGGAPQRVRDVLGASATPGRTSQAMEIYAHAYDEAMRTTADVFVTLRANAPEATPAQASLVAKEIIKNPTGAMAKADLEIQKQGGLSELVAKRIAAGAAAFDQWLATISATNPLQRPIAVQATPTRKTVAFSPYIHRQGMLASAGYLFEDFYRPMTFRAVLTSLYARTEARPRNQVMDWMESIGAVAAGLAGLGSLGPFDEDWFKDGVLVGTGVLLPELRKRLRDDIEKYVKNLEKLALDEVVKIDPLRHLDGYVFFPKGPIFGFGIDEFSVDTPTFIVNIDNSDVVADGLLVDKAYDIRAGRVDAEGLTKEALDRGREERTEEEREQLELEEGLRRYDLAELSRRVHELNATKDEADARRARALVVSFIARHGDLRGSTLLKSLKTEVGLGAEEVVMEPSAAEIADRMQRVDDLLGNADEKRTTETLEQARALVLAFAARHPHWQARGHLDDLFLRVGLSPNGAGGAPARIGETDVDLLNKALVAELLKVKLGAAGLDARVKKTLEAVTKAKSHLDGLRTKAENADTPSEWRERYFRALWAVTDLQAKTKTLEARARQLVAQIPGLDTGRESAQAAAEEYKRMGGATEEAVRTRDRLYAGIHKVSDQVHGAHITLQQIEDLIKQGDAAAGSAEELK